MFKLRHDLVDMLNIGFPDAQKSKNRWWNPEEFESLWFGVAGGRRTAKISAMTAAERRDYYSSGTYGLLVVGALRDVFGLAAAMWVVAALTSISGLVSAVRMSETLPSLESTSNGARPRRYMKKRPEIRQVS